MKISEPQLTRIYFKEKFHTLYELKEDIPVILNSLIVYTVKDDWIDSKVDFKIFTNPKDGKRYISPLYNPAHCDCFVLTGERLAMCKTFEIKAEEYVDVTKFNGDFCFTFEADKDDEVE